MPNLRRAARGPVVLRRPAGHADRRARASTSCPRRARTTSPRTSPTDSLVLRRNPNYDGTGPRELEEIRYEIGVPPERGVDGGRGGTGGLRRPRSARRARRPGRTHQRLDGASTDPDSEAARAGRQQLFTQPAPEPLLLRLQHAAAARSPTATAQGGQLRDRPAGARGAHRASARAAGRPTSTSRPACRGSRTRRSIRSAGPDLATRAATGRQRARRTPSSTRAISRAAPATRRSCGRTSARSGSTSMCASSRSGILRADREAG